MATPFFCQAEDGIRYHCVTGVQTCALPISVSSSPKAKPAPPEEPGLEPPDSNDADPVDHRLQEDLFQSRSEERRVGKECRTRGPTYLETKNTTYDSRAAPPRDEADDREPRI